MNNLVPTRKHQKTPKNSIEVATFSDHILVNFFMLKVDSLDLEISSFINSVKHTTISILDMLILDFLSILKSLYTEQN